MFHNQSYLHIYGILPVFRMNSLQAEKSSKVVVLRFFPRFQFNGRNDFFWKRQPVTELSELKHF